MKKEQKIVTRYDMAVTLQPLQSLMLEHESIMKAYKDALKNPDTEEVRKEIRKINKRLVRHGKKVSRESEKVYTKFCLKG